MKINNETIVNEDEIKAVLEDIAIETVSTLCEIYQESTEKRNILEFILCKNFKERIKTIKGVIEDINMYSENNFELTDSEYHNVNFIVEKKLSSFKTRFYFSNASGERLESNERFFRTLEVLKNNCENVKHRFDGDYSERHYIFENMVVVYSVNDELGIPSRIKYISLV